VGFGVICGDRVIQGRWAQEAARPHSSAYAELVPLLFAVEHFAPTAAGGVLVLTSDNMGNVHTLNKGAARDPESHRLLQHIYAVAAQYSVFIIADWVPREHNTVADDLSKWVLRYQRQ
jgi:hypothetical protein